MDADRGGGLPGAAIPACEEHVVAGVRGVVQLDQGEVGYAVAGPEVGAGLELIQRASRQRAAGWTLVVPVGYHRRRVARRDAAVIGRQEVRLPVLRRVVEQRPRAKAAAANENPGDASDDVTIRVGFRTDDIDVARQLLVAAGVEDVEESAVDRTDLQPQVVCRARRQRDLDHDFAPGQDRRPQFTVTLVVGGGEGAENLGVVRRVDPQASLGRHGVAREPEAERHRALGSDAQAPDAYLAAGLVPRFLPTTEFSAGRRDARLERGGELQRSRFPCGPFGAGHNPGVDARHSHDLDRLQGHEPLRQRLGRSGLRRGDRRPGYADDHW